MKINKQTLLSLVKNNFLLKILSLFFAIVIWLVVVQYVNPEDTRTLNDIKIHINLEDSVPRGEGLVLVTDYNNTMSITYSARRDVIYTLNTDKIKAYVDLSSATNSGEFSFPVKIDTGGQNINIESQSVREAVLKFEKSATAQVKINATVNGNVADGFVKYDPVCMPSVLSIEGPESKVSKIVSAEVVINESLFKETKVYSCDYVFVDAEGNSIDKKYITTDYEKIDVTVPVKKTKSLPITANVINSSGGNDASFVTLDFSPANIVVAGSSELLDTMNSYDIGTIDVAEKSDNFTTEVQLSLQNGIENVDAVSSVKVNVKFDNLRIKKIKFSTFEIQNLPEGSKVSVVDNSLDVSFRGVSSDVEKINTSNVKLVIDLKDKTKSKGKSRVPVYAIIPEEYKVGVIGKYEVTINIS